MDNPQSEETQWYIKPAGADTYNIVNVKSNKCANIAGVGMENNAKVHQWDNPSRAESRFRIQRRGEHYTIEASHSGKFLNARDNGTHNGTKVQQYDNPGSSSSQWIIRRCLADERQVVHAPFLPNYRYVIENKNANGKYLSVDSGANGASIHLMDNPQSEETQWYIKPAGGDTYNIVNVKSNKCANIAGAGMENNVKVHQWDNPSRAESRFRIQRRGEHYTIEASHSGKFLNARGNGTHNGTKVQQYDNPV